MIEIDKNKTANELFTELNAAMKILRADKEKVPIICNLTYARKTKITKDFESYLCPEFEFDREQFKKQRDAVAFFLKPVSRRIHIISFSDPC